MKIMEIKYEVFENGNLTIEFKCAHTNNDETIIIDNIEEFKHIIDGLYDQYTKYKENPPIQVSEAEFNLLLKNGNYNVIY